MELEKKPSLAVDVFSGAGLGLLLGVIIGMAHSPVVATVVGAIASVLAVFLGLEGGDSKLAAIAKVQLNGIRIGSFALATVVGLFLGLYVRINNPLVESPVDQLSRWHEAFPAETAPSDPVAGSRYAADENEAKRNRILARQLMIFERTGLKPESLDYGQTKSVGSSAGSKVSPGDADRGGGDSQESVSTSVELSGEAGARLAILFGDENESNLCTELSPEKNTHDGIVKVDGWLIAFSAEGFDGVVKTVSAADESDKEQLLRISHQLLCDMSRIALGEEE